METKGIITVAVTVTVAVIVLAGILMPVLTDATKTEDKYTNEGYYGMTYTETENITLEWDHTKPSIATVNGVDMNLPTDADVSLTICCGDTWLMRYLGDKIEFYTNATTHIDASVTAGTDGTLVASGGSYTFTTTADSNNTKTGTYTYLYCVDNDGQYVMKYSGDSAYVNGDSIIYGQGRTYVSSTNNTVMAIVTGTIDDGVTATNVFPSEHVSFSDVVINDTPVSDHEDLYQISTISFTLTNDSTDPVKTGTITYSYFLVPAEVTAERTVHFTDSMNGLLAVIPILILVAVLIGVAAVVLRNRM